MKPKNNFGIAVLLLALFIAACNSASTQKAKEIDVRAGFSGMTLEFLKNTPPQRIFEGDKFPVALKVKNTGAADVKEDKAFLSLGFEKDYTKNIELLHNGNIKLFQGTNTENTAMFGLEGRSQINQKGGEEVISYNLVAGRVDPQSEVHSSTAIATLCYPYKTVLDATVCIDTDPSGLRPGKKVCSLKDLTFANGQGAPLAITKIEVQMLPSQESQESPEGYGKIVPQFLIFIENRGQGIAVKDDAVQEFCTQGKISHDELNTIFVTASLPGKQGIERLGCEPKQKGSSEKQGYDVKLKDKKDMIRCTFKAGIDSTQDSYLSPLKIELSYGYSQSISANYLIQKTAR